MRRGLWFLAGWLSALVVVIVLYNVGLSTTSVVEAPMSPQHAVTDELPAPTEQAPIAAVPTTEPPPATLEIPPPEDESGAIYFAWLGEATLRLRYLSDRYVVWIDSVTASFPDAPDSVRETGRRLQTDWTELGAAVDTVEPPERYRQVHARLSDGVKLYTDSTTKVYEALVERDPNLLNAGLVFGDLADRALAPILEVAQASATAQPTPEPSELAAATPTSELATSPAETLPAAAQPMDAGTPTPSQTPPVLLAVVMAESLNVRSAPGAEHDPIGSVVRGTELLLDGRSGSGVWVHGRVPGRDLEGWFSAIGSMLIQGGVMELPVLD